MSTAFREERRDRVKSCDSENRLKFDSYKCFLTHLQNSLAVNMTRVKALSLNGKIQRE